MSFEERVQILSEAEQDEFYGPPAFTSADQRFFFALNDKERAVAQGLRHRGQRYMLVVLLSPGFYQIKQDLKYVHQIVLPGPGCRPFNLTPKENERIYQRIFGHCNYQRWNAKEHGSALSAYLSQQARAWTAPRHLFDAAIEYIAGQKMISQVAEKVDYYGAKLKRQTVDNQRLYLLCYLQTRWQQALGLLAKKDLESVCLFLNEQRRLVDEAMWQYYDEKDSLRKGLLRDLFLCLRFEGNDGTQHLAAALANAKNCQI